MCRRKVSLIIILIVSLMFPLRASLAFAETIELSSAPGDGTVEEWLKQQNEQKDKKEKNKKENKETEQEIVKTSGQSLWLSFLKLIVASIFVIGLLVFLLKFLNKRTKEFQEGKAMQNLGGISVGTNKSVQLVKLGDEILVLGVGENVQLLKEINDPNKIQEFAIISGNDETNRFVPIDSIKQWLNQKSTKKENKDVDFKTLIQKELKKSKKERKEMIQEVKEKGKDL
ncbi:MAG TPA: flagellar biosynthetic protein FliO [Bacteroidales bacterium]|nr:flagellar biosynthetic protein FliO [Bacteroidales bacterium]